MGFPLFTLCTPANVSDDAGLIELLTQNMDYFRSKPVNLPKTTILLDHGYHPETLRQALEQVYPQIMRKIKFERSPKSSKAEKAAAGQTGFVPVAARWVVDVPMPGWNGAKAWSRTLRELRPMPPLSSIYASSGSCSSGWQPLRRVSNGFYS